jgi:hypothetical protein
MIKAGEIVTRIDIIQEVFDKLMKSECAMHSDSWEIVEDGRKSEATWAGDENHQILKATFDEREMEAKNANIKRKIALNELRDYERSTKPKQDAKDK